MRFSLGVNYWPRRSAMSMWRRFDAGEIREDLARMAELGLDAIRFFLRWDDFQPDPHTLDRTMLTRLEALADLIAEAGLQAMPTLFCGHMSGVNWLPSWTLDQATPAGRFRTVTERGESPNGIGDFYQVGELLDAQVRLARAVGERLRTHPAVSAWDVGNEFSNLREPASDADAAHWSGVLVDALQTASGLPVTAGTHGEDLTLDRRIRLSSLCAPYPYATMHGYSVYSTFARDRLDADVVPFLAALAAAFARKPVLFTEFGNPSSQPGTTLPFATLDEDEMATYCTTVLERLHADGHLGAWWWCWTDYDEALHDEPPFDRAPHERAFGILRSDGSDKPVAAALAAFARQRRSVLPAPPPAIDVPEAAYYAALPDATEAAYATFLAAVEERRRAVR
jgi:endo-1,4-beta-mannosidase